MVLSRSCEVCFEDYTAERPPLKLFCCKKLLCQDCVDQIKSHSYCPWDRRRWNSRTLKGKCLECTPNDLLEQILSLPSEENVIAPQGLQKLGDGALRREYEHAMSIEREKDEARRKQEESDLILAKELANRAGASPIHSSSSSSTSSSSIRVPPVTSKRGRDAGSPEISLDRCEGADKENLSNSLSGGWTCRACTYLNSCSRNKCDICLSHRNPISHPASTQQKEKDKKRKVSASTASMTLSRFLVPQPKSSKQD